MPDGTPAHAYKPARHTQLGEAAPLVNWDTPVTQLLIIN